MTGSVNGVLAAGTYNVWMILSGTMWTPGTYYIGTGTYTVMGGNWQIQ